MICRRSKRESWNSKDYCETDLLLKNDSLFLRQPLNRWIERTLLSNRSWANCESNTRMLPTQLGRFPNSNCACVNSRKPLRIWTLSSRREIRRIRNLSWKSRACPFEFLNTMKSKIHWMHVSTKSKSTSAELSNSRTSLSHLARSSNVSLNSKRWTRNWDNKSKCSLANCRMSHKKSTKNARRNRDRKTNSTVSCAIDNRTKIRFQVWTLRLKH